VAALCLCAAAPYRRLRFVNEVAEETRPMALIGELEFRSLLEKLPTGAYTCDAQGLITYFNQRAVQLWGRAPKLNDPRDRFCGSSKLFSPEGSPISHDRCWMALALENEREYNRREIVVERPDGERLTALAYANPIRDGSGKLLGAVNVLVDISDRKRAQEEIETRARQQAVIAELGRWALTEDDLSALVEMVVETAARTLGVEYSEVLELLPEGGALLLRAGVGWKEGLVGRATVGSGLDSQAGYTLFTDGPVVVEDLRAEKRFGGPPLLHEHEVVSSMSVVIRGRERPFGVLGAHTKSRRTFTVDDVNFLRGVANVLAAAIERKEAEDALYEVRAAERGRLARDLHDTALQDLAYALTQMQLVQSTSEGPGTDQCLELAVEALKRAGRELRATVHDLQLEEERGIRPLLERLESLVELHRRMASDRGVYLEVEDGFPSSPLGKRDSELLRILQEALNNVRRHSEAGEVWVGLGTKGNKIWAEVEDDGRGFDPGSATGLGSTSMRQRARALGGELKVESGLGQGTRVRFEKPLGQEDGEEGPEPEGEIRVLLVEDHASFREAAASVFEREPGMEVVGQAGSVAEARGMLYGVDVAVVDLFLPDGWGTTLIEELGQASPEAQALVLSASLERAQIARAVEAGAAGVLHKSVGIDQVIDAVRRLRTGETLMAVEEAVELLRFAGAKRDQEHEAHLAIAELTPREREVLEALAEGLDGKDIAEKLNISVPTERNHVASILAKLGVHSRLQALVFALRHGVVEIH
jgi:PAS domain S-box-containing protein